MIQDTGFTASDAEGHILQDDPEENQRQAHSAMQELFATAARFHKEDLRAEVLIAAGRGTFLVSTPVGRWLNGHHPEAHAADEMVVE